MSATPSTKRYSGSLKTASSRGSACMGHCGTPKPSSLLTSTLALQLAITAAGFGGTAWILPWYRRDYRVSAMPSLHHAGLGWGPRESIRVRERSTTYGHVSGTRKRVRITVAKNAAATAAPNADGNGQGATSGDNGSISSSSSGGAMGGREVDYYSILGLCVGASGAEIKEAYRGLIAKVHPDRDPSNESREKFEVFTIAYDVLSDPGKRSTYDQGLAMRRFVDEVKAGNWAKTLGAVANLGAVATTVGVSVGVAAAQPLAKDLAQGLVDVATGGLQAVAQDPDTLSREQLVVQKAKAESERKLAMLQKKTQEALAEAAAKEEEAEARLKEQGNWKLIRTEKQQETVEAKRILEDMEASVVQATGVLGERKTGEQEATEAFRRSKAAREAFAQASTASKRKISSAEATVATAERRLAEALKALDSARVGLELASQQDVELEGRRGQIFRQEESTEKALVAAKELSLGGRSALSERQGKLGEMQADLRAKTKAEVLAEAKVKELGDAAQAAAARALRLRKSAGEFQAATVHEAQALEVATREEAWLKAEAAAAKAAEEAAKAAAREEDMQRERERAAAEAQAAVARARAAEEAAGAAAAAAVEAAEAAKKATADAAAVAAEAERRRLPRRLSPTTPSPVDTVDADTREEGDGLDSRGPTTVHEGPKVQEFRQGHLRADIISNTEGLAVPEPPAVADTCTPTSSAYSEGIVTTTVNIPAAAAAAAASPSTESSFVVVNMGKEQEEETDSSAASSVSIVSRGATSGSTTTSDSTFTAIADDAPTGLPDDDDDGDGGDDDEDDQTPNRRPSYLGDRWSKGATTAASRRREQATGIMRFLSAPRGVRAMKRDADAAADAAVLGDAAAAAGLV